MGVLTPRHATSIFTLDATLKYGEIPYKLTERMQAALLEEIRKVEGVDLPTIINQIEIHSEGHLIVHSAFERSKEAPQLYLPAKKVLEMHLFEKGSRLLDQLHSEQILGWRAALLKSKQKFYDPFASGWAAVRNGAGLVIAVLNLLALLGVVSVSPQLCATLLIVYACFVLVQGLLALGPAFLGNAVDGELQNAQAAALGDERGRLSAQLKSWDGIFSLVTGAFWITIAVADFSGMFTLSSLLTKILFWGIFNFTFIYMSAVAYRDYRWHSKFKRAIVEKLGVGEPNYVAALEYVRDKWHMHLKPSHSDLDKEQLIQKAGRKLARFEGQTSEQIREKMGTVDALIARLHTNEQGAEIEAQKLLNEIRGENKKRIIRDIVTIALGIVGVICWFDITITWAGHDIAGAIVDWSLWVALNLGFLFMLDSRASFEKLAAHFAKKESPQVPEPAHI